MSYSAVIGLNCVFRRQLPTKANFTERCIHCATRMTDDRHDESVHNETIHGVDDTSLHMAIDAITSMLDFSGTACNKTNDLHLVKPAVETGTAVIRCDGTDECTSITLIAYCLAQYISTLNVEHQRRVQSLLHSDTINWISKLFR